ncbi:MAG: CsbD family protein [Thermodesulfobacteriota bacterium]
MDWDRIKDNWKQIRAKAREKWRKLTDDDLHIVSGNRERLIEKLKQRYCRSKEETQKEVDRWSENL